jgi:23S rRNA (adenine2503-C2)-methyltransferase
VNLLNLHPIEAQASVEEWLSRNGEPSYRARQVVPRLWQRPVRSWQDATDLPRSLRERLENELPLPRPTLSTQQASADGTVKFLWDFGSGGTVESVLIPEGRRRTLCISSQAGCAFGCVFCATGRMGFIRHLEAWEIASQVRELMLEDATARPTNVVFMGMGEPLHNWSAVDLSLSILNHPAGIGLGARHITVSTVGIVPNLVKLAARPEQFRVALSLHAPRSALRRRMMPVEKKYPLAKVMRALERFSRRITFEYVMIRDLNDGEAEAAELAQLAQPLGALVNLLPLHPGGAPGFGASSPDRIKRFAQLVGDRGVSVTVRRSRGLDIAAACGQLRVESDQGGSVPSKIDTHVKQ